MYGGKLRGEIDTIIPQTEHTSFDDPASYCEAVSPRNLELHERVASNIDLAQEKMKTAYDQKSRSSNISPGDWVLIRDETRSSTLAPLYLGPWLVVERLGVNLNLVDPSSERKKITHLNRCKLSPRNRELTGEFSLPTSYNGVSEFSQNDIEMIGTDDSVMGRDAASGGPRRSTRRRKEPDRFGDFEGYFQNRGNHSSVEILEGEGDCHVVS